jgi:hypothetical protein
LRVLPPREQRYARHGTIRQGLEGLARRQDPLDGKTLSTARKRRHKGRAKERPFAPKPEKEQPPVNTKPRPGATRVSRQTHEKHTRNTRQLRPSRSNQPPPGDTRVSRQTHEKHTRNTRRQQPAKRKRKSRQTTSPEKTRERPNAGTEGRTRNAISIIYRY